MPCLLRLCLTLSFAFLAAGVRRSLNEDFYAALHGTAAKMCCEVTANRGEYAEYFRARSGGHKAAYCYSSERLYCPLGRNRHDGLIIKKTRNARNCKATKARSCEAYERSLPGRVARAERKRKRELENPHQYSTRSHHRNTSFEICCLRRSFYQGPGGTKCKALMQYSQQRGADPCGMCDGQGPAGRIPTASYFYSRLTGCVGSKLQDRHGNDAPYCCGGPTQPLGKDDDTPDMDDEGSHTPPVASHTPLVKEVMPGMEDEGSTEVDEDDGFDFKGDVGNHTHPDHEDSTEVDEDNHLEDEDHVEPHTPVATGMDHEFSAEVDEDDELDDTGSGGSITDESTADESKAGPQGGLSKFEDEMPDDFDFGEWSDDEDVEDEEDHESPKPVSKAEMLGEEPVHKVSDTPVPVVEGMVDPMSKDPMPEEQEDQDVHEVVDEREILPDAGADGVATQTQPKRKLPQIPKGAKSEKKRRKRRLPKLPPPSSPPPRTQLPETPQKVQRLIETDDGRSEVIETEDPTVTDFAAELRDQVKDTDEDGTVEVDGHGGLLGGAVGDKAQGYCRTSSQKVRCEDRGITKFTLCKDKCCLEVCKWYAGVQADGTSRSGGEGNQIASCVMHCVKAPVKK